MINKVSQLHQEFVLLDTFVKWDQPQTNLLLVQHQPLAVSVNEANIVLLDLLSHSIVPQENIAKFQVSLLSQVFAKLAFIVFLKRQEKTREISTRMEVQYALQVIIAQKGHLLHCHALPVLIINLKCRFQMRHV